MKILVVLCCIMTLAHARVVDVQAGPNPDDPVPEETPAPEGEDTPEETTAPAETSPTLPTEPGDAGEPTDPGNTGEPTPPEETAIPPEEEATTNQNLHKDITVYCPTENPKIVAKLLLGKDEEPPDNVVTDKSGSPVTDAVETEFLLPRKTVQIYSESWRTYYTPVPTKVNCLCQTRGPLSRFKLIGNLHFKNIKIPINRRRLSTTENAITDCPPCNCADCFTTESVTTKRKKVC